MGVGSAVRERYFLVIPNDFWDDEYNWEDLTENLFEELDLTEVKSHQWETKRLTLHYESVGSYYGYFYLRPNCYESGRDYQLVKCYKIHNDAEKLFNRIMEYFKWLDWSHPTGAWCSQTIEKWTSDLGHWRDLEDIEAEAISNFRY